MPDLALVTYMTTNSRLPMWPPAGEDNAVRCVPGQHSNWLAEKRSSMPALQCPLQQHERSVVPPDDAAAGRCPLRLTARAAAAEAAAAAGGGRC